MSTVGLRLRRNLLWNTLQTWGSTALTLAASILFARLLQPEAWGVYSTFLWLVATGPLLVVPGWDLPINKRVAGAAGTADPTRAAPLYPGLVLPQAPFPQQRDGGVKKTCGSGGEVDALARLIKQRRPRSCWDASPAGVQGNKLGRTRRLGPRLGFR